MPRRMPPAQRSSRASLAGKRPRCFATSVSPVTLHALHFHLHLISAALLPVVPISTRRGRGEGRGEGRKTHILYTLAQRVEQKARIARLTAGAAGAGRGSTGRGAGGRGVLVRLLLGLAVRLLLSVALLLLPVALPLLAVTLPMLTIALALLAVGLLPLLAVALLGLLRRRTGGRGVRALRRWRPAILGQRKSCV